MRERAAVAAWAVDPARQYRQEAITKFLGSADYELIAHALAFGATVVTRERPAPDSKKKIKIPDACDADVQRPVVSMWRRRPKAGLGFPSPLPDGRFDALEVVDWLEATKRGNNPDARGDLAIGTTLSSTTDPELLAILRLLVATRALLNEPLAGLDPDDLLDEAEELDPDGVGVRSGACWPDCRGSPRR